MEKMNISSAVQAFAQAKPWRRAGTGGALVMGIEGLNSHTVYAVVTGQDNGCTLALCMNTYALSTYAALLTAKKQKCDDMEMTMLLLEQDYLECRLDEADDALINRMLGAFGVKVPGGSKNPAVIRRHKPALLPDPAISEQELEGMGIALQAAAAFADMEEASRAQLGSMDGSSRIPCARWNGSRFEWNTMNLHNNSNVEFVSPLIQDEVTVRRLCKLPSSGAELTCAIRILPMPVSEAPVTMPWMMVMLDDQSGVVGTPIIADYEQDYAVLVGEVLSYIEECGRPSQIVTVDPRTYCLLGGIAGQLGIATGHSDDVSIINETISDFLGYMKQSVLAQQEEEAVPERPAHPSGSGICIACGKECSAEEMTEHALFCAGQRTETDGDENFILRIASRDDLEYWLYAELKKDAALYQLDNFIREEWVECCGHMSMFRIQGEEYYSRCDDMTGGHSMRARIAGLMKTGDEFDYEYDFGSPTRLHLEVVGEARLPRRHKKARLIAQNIRPRYACICCGKPAEYVFRPDGGPIAQSVYCSACVQAMENAHEMLPLLNSPRAGMCTLGRWDELNIQQD